MAEVIKDIQKDNGDTIRVELSEYEGHKFLQIRIWFTNDDGELKPTKKGVSIPLNKIKDISEALSVAAEKVA